MKRIARWLSPATLGAVILSAAFGASLLKVLSTHEQLNDPNEVIIRIAHRQLESGYREALQSVIDEYEKLQRARFERGEISKPVRIIQMPITETIYGQWLNTHLIGGDAPDLISMGASRFVVNDSYVARYFVPFSDLIEHPNPYNKGTPLESVPWRDTFIDSMQGVFSPNLQDYYSIPTTLSTIRLFYNKDILRRATGKDTPPQTFGELMDACRKIRALPDAQAPLIPIAASSYNIYAFQSKYTVPFTASFEPALDVDMDGIIQQREVYAGFLTGKWNFQTPAIKAYFACFKDLCDQLPVGFMAMDRQQVAFLFIQGKAAMVGSGSWDAESLARQTRGKFQLGITDFPLPAPGEKYGEDVLGRANEAAVAAGGGFGLYKMSHNQPQAIDFLRFLTSQHYNEMLNAKANWYPVTVGSVPSKLMQSFAPDPTGYDAKMDFAYGTSFVLQVYNGQLWRYLQGEIGYNEFATNVEAAIRNPTYGDDRSWAIERQTLTNNVRNQERVLAVEAARMLMDPTPIDARKFRQCLLQQIRANNGEELRFRYEQLRGQAMPEP